MYIVDAQKSYKEYQGKLPDFEKEKFQRIMREISISTDSLIFDYIKQNSKSYIGLWKLVERFSERGYSELFENAYSYLSKSLQHTFTGKYLFYSLNESKVTGKGRVFPALSLSNTMDRIQKIMVGKEKFTLIDFWYSHCGPCIAEFPDVRDIYNTYKNKSFNIIGISVDREDDKNDWKAAIEKYGLDWEQLWDKDGTNSKKIFVNSYPTNFLLDSNGVIIQKNIKPDQLKKFLEKNL